MNIDDIRNIISDTEITLITDDAEFRKPHALIKLVKEYQKRDIISLIVADYFGDYSQIYDKGALDLELINLEELVELKTDISQGIVTNKYDFSNEDSKHPELVPYLINLDERLNTANKQAILFMDECPAVMYDDLLTYLLKHKFENINVVLFNHRLSEFPILSSIQLNRIITIELDKVQKA